MNLKIVYDERQITEKCYPPLSVMEKKDSYVFKYSNINKLKSMNFLVYLAMFM